MRPFGYARADTIEEALAAAGEPGTTVLAGGTELLNWMRLGLAAPERVVDITRAGGLDQVASLPGGGLRIGATVRLGDVASDPRVRSEWPVLREAIHKAASAQLRNLATIGGNLLQKTRCAYFRSEEPVPCNRRVPGSGCAGLRGRSDRHALFGWTEDCVATHPADPAVALAVLDAELRQRVHRANVNLPNPMRAPVEGCGLWALGSAINELAEQLAIDPVELRLANYAETHPVSGQPWSSKKLRECYEDGARAFDWRRRPSEPTRDGPWLVGQGMADCGMGCFRMPSEAAVRLRADGTAVIEAGFQDIGTGTLTIFPQIAGEVLGLEPGLVSCLMGDTSLPQAGPTYGSSSTMGVGAAVIAAAEDVLATLSERSGRELGTAPVPARSPPRWARRASSSSSARDRSRLSRTARTRCTPSARCSSRWESIPSSDWCGCAAWWAATASGGSSIRARHERR